MFKKFTIVFFLLALIISLNAVWKYEQEADSNGVDIKYGILADDWICTESGPIAEICFAHSWKDGIVGVITGIWVNIYDDNAGVPGSIIFTQYKSPGEISEYSGLEDWYDPYTDTYLVDNHTKFYKHKLILNPPFFQEAGTHYWLNIIVLVTGPEEIGWKTSLVNPYNTAVYFDIVWEPLIYSGLAFKLASTTDEVCPVELSSFTALPTSSSEVELKWITQSETDLLGYNIMRSTVEDANNISRCNLVIIPSLNSSTEQTYNFKDTEIQAPTTYWYWLESVERGGATELHGPVRVNVTNPGNPDTPPADVNPTVLHVAFPNPFTSTTKISYDLQTPGNVRLEILNLKGQRVKVLDNSVKLSSGTYSYYWDGTNDYGKRLSAGLYLYQLKTDNHMEIKKVVLLTP